MTRRAVSMSLSLLTLFLMGWWCAGIGLERGAELVVFYLGCLVMIFAPLALPRPLLEGKKVEPEPPAVPFPFNRNSVLQGTVEAIKTLTVHAQEQDQKIKALEARMSEMCLAAGLKLRRPGGDMGAPAKEEKARGV